MSIEKYKIISYCSFYAGGDAGGECMLYGSNDITKSRKCEDINCQWKGSGGEKFRCGHCGIEFEPYHDGQGINTGMCPKCFREWDTIGLDEKPTEPCGECKHEFPSISERCKSCYKTKNSDKFEPKEETEPKKSQVSFDSEEEIKMRAKCRSMCHFYKSDHSACHYCEDWRYIKLEKPKTEPENSDDREFVHFDEKLWISLSRHAQKQKELIEGFIKFIDHFEERYEGNKCGECLEYWKTIKKHYKGV